MGIYGDYTALLSPKGGHRSEAFRWGTTSFVGAPFMDILTWPASDSIQCQFLFPKASPERFGSLQR